MPEKDHSYTPCTYNLEAANELLANGDFIEAFIGAMRLLGTALVQSPKTQDFKDALRAIQGMDLVQDWPFENEELLQRAQTLFAQGAQSEDETALVRAYTRLFRGPGHLPAPPWASVYMDRDQVMYGWTWVELRSWMRSHGFVGSYEENDPEDNFGRMLILASEVAQNKPELLCEYLGNHLLCWTPRFLELLEESAQSPSYAALSVLAQATLQDLASLFDITPAKKPLYY